MFWRLWKKKLKAQSTDTSRTLIYTGRPARMYKTDYQAEWEARGAEVKELLEKGESPFARALDFAIGTLMILDTALTALSRLSSRARSRPSHAVAAGRPPCRQRCCPAATWCAKRGHVPSDSESREAGEKGRLRTRPV